MLLADCAEALDGADDSFAEEVREGLSARPKRLSCTWLYDDEGSRLFEQICDLPEYYLTRAEQEILARHAHEIARRFPRGVSLIELGSGSARKTTLLIDALLAGRGQLRYLPVDVSRSMLLESSAQLAARHRGLTVRPIPAEYQVGLRMAQALERDRPKLIVWLGSSIGNFDRAAASAFLGSARALTSYHDRLLVGIDLRKPGELLERAYDDAQGVTARFNLNLLHRINRQLGGRFALDHFHHRAVWDEEAGRVGMYLVADRAQRVAIDALGVEIAFADGETIHTESSYKYDFDEIEALARGAGFSVEQRWLDERRQFSLNLLRPAHH